MVVEPEVDKSACEFDQFLAWRVEFLPSQFLNRHEFHHQRLASHFHPSGSCQKPPM
uniref:Uncharacterized protein n=1 Tax=Rhizophora mucronata TaxID=61149 RepID=A0A2P2IXD0_RHIMU